MAGLARLNLTDRARFIALCGLVLFLHAVTLLWLERQFNTVRVLRPLASPMFTRLLEAQQPTAPPAATARVEPAPVTRPTVTQIEQAPAQEISPLATKPPQPVASAPQPEPPEPEVAWTPPTPVPPTPAEPVPDTVAAPSRDDAPVAAEATPGLSAQQPAPRGSGSSGLNSWPADTRLSYRLTGSYRGPLHGSATVEWQRKDSTYQTRVEIDINLLASLVLTSQGEIAPSGLMPRAYEEMRRSGPRGVRMGERLITLNDGRTLPRPEGVQDTASQFIELSHRFAMGIDKLEIPGSVSLWLARPGGVDQWTYDIVKREAIETPMGLVEAFQLKPRPIANPRGNIYPEIWFAPALLYLPVRIRIDMGENIYVDLHVEKIEQR